ncbi:MAG TPA: dihydropteroate synthase, partial [Candidatus Gracilibacteria bacterium]
MVAVAAKFQATCVVNHFPGKTPEAVHQKSIDSLEQVRDELLKRKTSMMEMGIKPENIILDPGIGFGKTMELNERLLRFAEIVPGERVLIGHSRKRFLGEHRFEEGPNLQAAKEAIEGGAEFLRVHDPEIYQALIKG